MRLVLVLGLTLLVSPFLYGNDTPPSYTCPKEKVNGAKFTCIASNVEGYTLAPEWNLYLKRGIYRVYGDEFTYHRTPNTWTLLEMKVYLDTYENYVYLLRSWVRVCDGRAVFFRYTEGVEPPSCTEGRRLSLWARDQQKKN